MKKLLVSCPAVSESCDSEWMAQPKRKPTYWSAPILQRERWVCCSRWCYFQGSKVHHPDESETQDSREAPPILYQYSRLFKKGTWSCPLAQHEQRTARICLKEWNLQHLPACSRCHRVPQRPWEKVGCDIFTANNLDYLWTVDYYSDYFEVDELHKAKKEPQSLESWRNVLPAMEFLVHSTVTMDRLLLRMNFQPLPRCMSLNTWPVNRSIRRATVKSKMQ